MGFAFCKKNSENTYETVQPISPCKDYLNDVVYSEIMDKPCAAYGLHYKKNDIYDVKAGYAYMVIRIMENFGGSKYTDFDKDTANLKKNYKLLEQFINHFEKQKGLQVLSEIASLDGDKYLIKIPLFWCEATYLISLYALLLRVGQFWKGDKTPDKYLEEFKEFPPDSYLLNSALPKLKKVLTEKLPKQKMDHFYGGGDVHNCGIVNAHF